MKPIQTSILVVALLAGAAVPSRAQTSTPRPRGDAAGYIGWLAVDDGPRGPYHGGRWGSSLFGGAGAGWYWTEHLKLEADAGAGTTADSYRVEPMTVEGQIHYQPVHASFQRRTLGISQQYQFLRNAWFHPHVAAGAHLTWERRTDRYQPLVVYGHPAVGRIVRESFTEGPRTTVTVRPFVAAGFKAYVTPRAFFRSDLRLALRRGFEESVLRAGFGVDF